MKCNWKYGNAQWYRWRLLNYAYWCHSVVRWLHHRWVNSCMDLKSFMLKCMLPKISKRIQQTDTHKQAFIVIHYNMLVIWWVNNKTHSEASFWCDIVDTVQNKTWDDSCECVSSLIFVSVCTDYNHQHVLRDLPRQQMANCFFNYPWKW